MEEYGLSSSNMNPAKAATTPFLSSADPYSATSYRTSSSVLSGLGRRDDDDSLRMGGHDMRDGHKKEGPRPPLQDYPHVSVVVPNRQAHDHRNHHHQQQHKEFTKSKNQDGRGNYSKADNKENPGSSVRFRTASPEESFLRDLDPWKQQQHYRTQ
jgi:hypothetical protein